MLNNLVLRVEVNIHENLFSEITILNEVWQQTILQVSTPHATVECVLEVLWLCESYFTDCFAVQDFLAVEIIFLLDLDERIWDYVLQVWNLHHHLQRLTLSYQNPGFVQRKLLALVIDDIWLKHSRSHHNVLLIICDVHHELLLAKPQDLWLMSEQVLMNVRDHVDELNRVFVLLKN